MTTLLRYDTLLLYLLFLNLLRFLRLSFCLLVRNVILFLASKSGSSFEMKSTNIFFNNFRRICSLFLKASLNSFIRINISPRISLSSGSCSIINNRCFIFKKITRKIFLMSTILFRHSYISFK